MGPFVRPPADSNPSPKSQSRGPNLNLEAQIPAQGPKSQLLEEEKENIPHMCESIGHRPLRGRCPAPSLNFNHNLLKQGTGTADHLTLLRLFSFPLFPY